MKRLKKQVVFFNTMMMTEKKKKKIELHGSLGNMLIRIARIAGDTDFAFVRTGNTVAKNVTGAQKTRFIYLHESLIGYRLTKKTTF
jgi:hypothetical protein